jgi:sugar phosphate isomerase/epimerase
MKIDQVAVQLYTIREHLKTSADFAKSLKRLREIGYKGVELAGLGPLTDKELKAMLDGEGLTCVSSHEPGEQLFNHTDQVIARLKTLGCQVAAYPYPSGVPLETSDDVHAFIRQLEKAGRQMGEAGIHLLYHNHNIEFRRIEGRLILGMIFDSTDRLTLGAELDTYWTQAGGDDPSRWCARLKGRLPILHMKDYGVQKNPEGGVQSAFKEIGRGNLSWREIVKAAEKAGCRKFVIEQDANWIDNDPFASLKVSYDFVREHLCR